MRPTKRSRVAKKRENLKRRRIDPLEQSAGSSNNSNYSPSDGSDTESMLSKPCCDEDLSPGQAGPEALEFMESETTDLSESDGEIMLDMDDACDENDWDPNLLPDLYPIFTQPVESFKAAEKLLRGLELEAKTCQKIQTFFKVTSRTAPNTYHSDESIKEASTHTKLACDGQIAILGNKHSLGTSIGGNCPNKEIAAPHILCRLPQLISQVGSSAAITYLCALPSPIVSIPASISLGISNTPIPGSIGLSECTPLVASCPPTALCSDQLSEAPGSLSGQLPLQAALTPMKQLPMQTHWKDTRMGKRLRLL
ncbi:hypothetical protein BDV93DRAFT_564139 [Ceratobasidium sp. AG-I]|nr:hypothetical protein BDV93DRAFT_564139 [Ceratobasidium sp. AG-I]